jgi:hypothetical protein
VARHRVVAPGLRIRVDKSALLSVELVFGLAPRTRPVQINPYWQHSGPAAINAVGVEGRLVSANGRYLAHSRRLQSTVAGPECDRCASAHGSESSGVTVDGVYGVDASRLTSR